MLRGEGNHNITVERRPLLQFASLGHGHQVGHCNFEFVGNQPDKGDVIPGTGGLRKLRWGFAGRGKRGGSRVIYYYHRPEWQVLLLTAYAKNEKDDLPEREKRLLAALVRNILKQEK